MNIVRGKTLLASRSFIELEIETQTAAEAFSIYNNQLGFLHNYIHMAAAKRELYGMTEAKESLCLALEIGEADNIVMPFAENALYIQDILVALAKEDNNNEYLARLVTLGKKYKKSIDTLEHSVALTEKELKVLSVAAKGYTREEIADEIHISLSTVKKHLSSSYVKLNAKNKTIAIKKAKDLKIL